MTAENQRKIVEATSRVFNAVSAALGREECGYEEGIRILREYGNRSCFDVFVEIVKRTMPVVGQGQDLTAETIPAFLDAMSTREKAKDFLALFPDMDPTKLDDILYEVNLFLPSIRKVLVPFAKQLPPEPGGHPRKISKEDEPKVRAEVAQLYNEGYSLPAAKREVARHRRISLSTIQRICRKGTRVSSEVAIED